MTVRILRQKPDSEQKRGEAKRHVLKLVENTLSGEKRTVPRRPPASKMRERKYLTPAEVELLYKGAKQTRYGARDALMVWMAYRHAFRASELCALKWSDLDWSNSAVEVKRLKNGRPSRQDLDEREIRGLRALWKQQDRPAHGFIFRNERGQPASAIGFHKTVRRIGASVPELRHLNVHPHALRHSAGTALANKGTDTRRLQEFMGHRDITHTVRYTELAAGRLAGIWD